MAKKEDKNQFVDLMVEKSKEKGVAKPQDRSGTTQGVDPDEVKDDLEEIQRRIQQS